MRRRLFDKKNKKGWVEVVEAFMAIVFLLGVIFMIIGSDKIQRTDNVFHEGAEHDILLKLQANETLRQEVISQSDFTIDSNDTGFSAVIKNFLDENTIYGSTCYTKICDSVGECNIDRDLEGDVYTSDVLITSSLTTYSPRKVKMFCRV